MQDQELRQFVGVLKNRLLGQENSLETMEHQSISRSKEINDLLKAIPQAHINELEFVIEKLEEILD